MAVITIKRFIIAFLFFIFLTSCTNTVKVPDNNSDNTTKPKISDYYPYKENLRMKYAGSGNEYAEQDVYVDIIKNNRIQLRVINPGTTVGQVIENKDGELRLITSTGELYFLCDLTSEINSNPEILLKEPLEKDTKWALPDGRTRFISSIDVEVSTPSGDYKALEVTTLGDDYTMLDYYVLNTGLVKRVFKSGESIIETSLEKIENDVSIQQTMKFYYPEFSKDRIVYVESKENFKTNHNIADTFENLFKTAVGDTLTPLMSQNTKINKLYINLQEFRVYIDFSKEFVNEMNAGTTLEAMILQSVTNTLGNYYNVDKVHITIDGSPYSSGHVQTSEKDNFYVDYDNTTEYKK
jgi:hypothetical protein